MDKQRIKCLDSLRGILCLIVLIAHIVSTNSVFGVYASGCGKIGVWCFIVLSGFLTFLPYALNKGAVIESKTRYVIKYYKRKVEKLYPTYIITLILALVLGFLTDSHSFIKHLICMEGVGHFWYMPVIIKFYLIAPFFIMLLGYVKEKVFIVLISVLTIVFSAVFPFTTYIENSISLCWYLPVFLLGCLLAYIYVGIKGRYSKVVNALSLFSIMSIVLLTPKMREIIWNMQPSGWLQNKYLIFAILWSAIILGVMQNVELSSSLSECRILGFIGKISYEVYLIHYLVIWKVVQYTTDTIIVAIIATTISILFATIINHITNALLNKNK